MSDLALAIACVLALFVAAILLAVFMHKPTKAKKEQELNLEPPLYFNVEAKAIVEKFRPLVDSEIAGEEDFEYSREMETANAKQCALIAVEFSEKALTLYGRENDELQNMDEEWRRIDKLKKAIEKYEAND